MINEEKVKIMTKIAMYEQGKGRRYLPVSKYYRSDYIGLALIKNFFLVTIGYALAIAAVAAYFGEYLMENIHKMNLVSMGIYIIVGYAVVLVPPLAQAAATIGRALTANPAVSDTTILERFSAMPK